MSSPRKNLKKSMIKKTIAINTPNLSLSSPIKIKRKTFMEEINNKFVLDDKEILYVNNRKDQNGIPIMKKSKMHKITFRDELSGKDLIETVTIESYKKYNLIEEEGNGNSSSKILSCRCIII